MNIKLHPEFIKDPAGNDLVVLPKHEFDMLIEELDNMYDIMLYDEAKKNDTGERISMEDAFKSIEHS